MALSATYYLHFVHAIILQNGEKQPFLLCILLSLLFKSFLSPSNSEINE